MYHNRKEGGCFPRRRKIKEYLRRNGMNSSLTDEHANYSDNNARRLWNSENRWLTYFSSSAFFSKFFSFEPEITVEISYLNTNNFNKFWRETTKFPAFCAQNGTKTLFPPTSRQFITRSAKRFQLVISTWRWCKTSFRNFSIHTVRFHNQLKSKNRSANRGSITHKEDSSFGCLYRLLLLLLFWIRDIPFDR